MQAGAGYKSHADVKFGFTVAPREYYRTFT